MSKNPCQIECHNKISLKISLSLTEYISTFMFLYKNQNYKNSYRNLSKVLMIKLLSQKLAKLIFSGFIFPLFA